MPDTGILALVMLLSGKRIPVVLHLFSYNFIFIVELKIGAIVKRIPDKFSHFIFIQISLAYIAAEFFIISTYIMGSQIPGYLFSSAPYLL